MRKPYINQWTTHNIIVLKKKNYIEYLCKMLWLTLHQQAAGYPGSATQSLQLCQQLQWGRWQQLAATTGCSHSTNAQTHLHTRHHHCGYIKLPKSIYCRGKGNTYFTAEDFFLVVLLYLQRRRKREFTCARQTTALLPALFQRLVNSTVPYFCATCSSYFLIRKY